MFRAVLEAKLDAAVILKKMKATSCFVVDEDRKVGMIGNLKVDYVGGTFLCSQRWIRIG